MTLSDRVRISGRFLRSVRIDSDLGEAKALDGFVCPQSSANVLLTMARHVSETGQGAFTWTGPYGGGKSSLVVALSALLGPDPAAQKQAQRVFGRKLTEILSTALPAGAEGWRVVPVVGRRDDPVKVIGEALGASRLIQRKPRGGWSESSLITALTQAAAANPQRNGGVLLFIDEMGKFLEAAAQQGADIYLFQQLAEAAARSGGRLVIVGILHQAFEEYAHRVSHQVRDEWAKIQGRFVDLAVSVAGDEQVDLISRAIESDHSPRTPGQLAVTVSETVHRERPDDATRFALRLESCWPLHPAVACLLGPMSRRRFGQNQRSIFGFLNSAEPYGFQDFLRRAAEGDLYGPDELWDYLRANLEPSILASPDGHRWAVAAEALERCDAVGGDALHLRLLKTIAMVDLFKDRSGLIASPALLKASLPDVPAVAVDDALEQLENWSLTIFKKFLGAHAIYAGSDFDIEEAVREALGEETYVDFSAVQLLAGLQPILAKRHYHDTGALRWFDVTLAPVSKLSDLAARFAPEKGTIGQFLLAIPADGERQDYAESVCREAARLSDEWDLVAGISSHSGTVATLARELVALEKVRQERQELAGDPVARREVAARQAALQVQLETQLHKVFDSAIWFRKHHKPKAYRHAELSILASELADRRFDQCPILHNELLNRHKPSSNAVAAQNLLLRRMVLDSGKPELGIDGFPAEKGLLVSILEATGLYANEAGEWRFLSPKPSDGNRLHPMWEVARCFVRSNAHRPIATSEIYDIWRRPPYGVKDGLMPVLAVAFILSCRNELAVYREGVFRARFDDVDVEYLAKDPATIQFRYMDISDVGRRLLSEMAAVVRGLDERNPLANLEPIDVARGLIAIFEGLPAWTKRTMQLSANAVRIRDLFKRARDPNRFLFDDIPAVADGAPLSGENLQRLVKGVREGLEELVHAYPTMLNRLTDLMLAELQVPNRSPRSLGELRDRATNISQLAGDFQLDAFIGRLSQFDGSDEAFEGIASLVASKPPRTWVDPDLDRAAISIADTSQRFLRAETFARVKGRRDKRQAMAVLVGMNGRPTPVSAEFHVAEHERATIDALVERMEGALVEAQQCRRSIILAALAELSARYMQAPAAAEPIAEASAVF